VGFESAFVRRTPPKDREVAFFLRDSAQNIATPSNF
jgi:hypothetical protein